jgi:hypothetical protein
MTTWPDPERLLIARYLAGLGLRSANSRTYYKQVLHSFQDVAERHAELGQDVLVAWLRASSDRWAASTRLHRTRKGKLRSNGANLTSTHPPTCGGCSISPVPIRRHGRRFAR